MSLLNELATGAPTAVTPPPSSSSNVTIVYHQTGACNGFTTPFGLAGAGGNFAYVIFGIEKLDNSGAAPLRSLSTPRSFMYSRQGKSSSIPPYKSTRLIARSRFMFVTTIRDAAQTC
jgi:hypothetical protein